MTGVMSWAQSLSLDDVGALAGVIASALVSEREGDFAHIYAFAEAPPAVSEQDWDAVARPRVLAGQLGFPLPEGLVIWRCAPFSSRGSLVDELPGWLAPEAACAVLAVQLREDADENGPPLTAFWADRGGRVVSAAGEIVGLDCRLEAEDWREPEVGLLARALGSLGPLDLAELEHAALVRLLSSAARDPAARRELAEAESIGQLLNERTRALASEVERQLNDRLESLRDRAAREDLQLRLPFDPDVHDTLSGQAAPAWMTRGSWIRLDEWWDLHTLAWAEGHLELYPYEAWTREDWASMWRRTQLVPEDEGEATWMKVEPELPERFRRSAFEAE